MASGPSHIDYLSSFLFRLAFNEVFSQALFGVKSQAFLSKSTDGFSFNGFLGVPKLPEHNAGASHQDFARPNLIHPALTGSWGIHALLSFDASWLACHAANRRSARARSSPGLARLLSGPAICSALRPESGDLLLWCSEDVSASGTNAA